MVDLQIDIANGRSVPQCAGDWRTTKINRERCGRLLEGLSGDAAPTVMDVGHIVILGATGMGRLMEAVKAHAFPHARAEAQGLCQFGRQVRGPMSRQSCGPPMVEAVERSR